MKLSHSLKSRIAASIFALAVLLMTSLLWYLLAFSYATSKYQQMKLTKSVTYYQALNVMLQAVQQAQHELQDQKYALDKAAIVSICDADGDITYVNERMCFSCSYSRSELAGKNYRMLGSSHHGFIEGKPSPGKGATFYFTLN